MSWTFIMFWKWGGQYVEQARIDSAHNRRNQLGSGRNLPIWPCCMAFRRNRFHIKQGDLYNSCNFCYMVHFSAFQTERQDDWSNRLVSPHKKTLRHNNKWCRIVLCFYARITLPVITGSVFTYTYSVFNLCFLS